MTTVERPVFLLACSDEWMCRSMDSVFAEQGVNIVRAASGPLALTMSRRLRPDVVILVDDLDGLDAVSVCRALRDDPLFDSCTPVVITSPTHLQRPQRTAAYEAGAWEFCSQPLDVELLMLKVNTFLRARTEIKRARVQGYIDPLTGLFSEFGLEQLSVQLSSRAMRKGEPLACLAIATESRATEQGSHARLRQSAQEGFDAMAMICRLRSRRSDVVGQAGAAHIGILAPDTDAEGTRNYVARLQLELDDASRRGLIKGEFVLRAGYCTMAELGDVDPDSPTLVRRAEAALDHLLQTRTGDSIVGYEQIR